ncbi:hypothetical protein FACS189451_11680 [Bacteroidia bacterium]|nr:hypothetical protein FACS189451_11680 [Bacteroidia bacterium]
MFKLGLFRYVFALSLITFFIELYKYNGKNKKRLYVLLIINIIGTITSVAKTSIFYLVIGSLIIYFFKKKRLPIKKIIVPVSLLLIIFCFIQIIRFQYLEQNDVVISMFQVYILGGLPAFDQLIFQDIHSGIFGERTLEFFYKFYEALGGEVQWGMGGDIFYVEMPLRTNVYTAMMPCYVDFDYWGLIFGGFIYGLIAAWSYKLACIGVKWAHVFYSFIAMGIILQFFDNFFYSMLSMSIQFFVWPYIATLPHPKFR